MMRLLLISNSGHPFLAHCRDAIADFLGPVRTVGYITAARLDDEAAVFAKAREALEGVGIAAQHLRLDADFRERLAGLWLHDLVAAHARLGPLRWVRPHPDVEAELLQRTRTGEGGLALALAPGERAAWLASLRDLRRERSSFSATIWA